MGKGSVRVLGRVYKIIRRKLDGLAGQCYTSTGVILIAPCASKFEIKDIVLHEIMHAILYQQNQSRPYKLEESFVRPLASGIIAVLQDNPDLAKWLIEPIKD